MRLWSYLENKGRRAVEVAHRRWGKDDVALHFTATATQKRIGNYWHMLPQFNQCRKAIWEAVNPHTGKKRIDEAFPEAIRKRTIQDQMFIEFKSGSIWQLVGSDNYNALLGSPPIGIVFSEWALADPQAWAYLSPILEENDGWAIFITTSRGNNHLKRLYDYASSNPVWFTELLPADKSPVFTPDKLEAIKKDMIGAFGEEQGEALFNQEYFCSFEGALPGSYYAKAMALARKENRITDVPWTSSLNVNTFWDLGVDDATTIWFIQQSGLQIRIIDYYENTGFGLEHYAKILKSKPYVYGDHYMPHDAAVRELSSGEFARSRQEVAEDLGIKPIIIVQRARDTQAVMTGINAARNILSHCWFDKTKCWQGISALEGYRAEYDETKKILANHPSHSWESHGADAFRTFAAGYVPVSKPQTNFRRSGGTWRSR